MAVKLRLRREGTKKTPHYRVVVADSRSPRNGRFIEIIGEYHPLDQPSTIRIDEERAMHWLQVGAQPTDQVKKLLRIVGVWEEFKPGDAPKRDRGATGEPTDRPSKKQRAKAKEEAAGASGAEEKAQPKAEKPEEPKAEEAPAEAPEAEEAPAEEPKAEEAPAEEPKAEEAPAEEAETKAAEAAEETAEAEAPDEETAGEGGE